MGVRNRNHLLGYLKQSNDDDDDDDDNNDNDDDDYELLLWHGWQTKRVVLFPAGTIVRDSHHRESQTRRKQDLSLISGFVERSCVVMLTIFFWKM